MPCVTPLGEDSKLASVSSNCCVPVSFAAFALCPFAIINFSHGYSSMLSPEPLNLEVVLGTPQTAFFHGHPTLQSLCYSEPLKQVRYKYSHAILSFIFPINTSLVIRGVSLPFINKLLQKQEIIFLYDFDLHWCLCLIMSYSWQWLF